MEQNNFEKNVQQKLDELKIPPSDSVWTNVENRIGKKDKDGKIIFILFFTLVLLSADYWFFNLRKNDLQQNQISKLKENSKPINKHNSFFDKAVSSKSCAKKPDSTSISIGNAKNALIKIKNKTLAQKTALSNTKIGSAEKEKIILLLKNENQKKENNDQADNEVNPKTILTSNQTEINQRRFNRSDSALKKMKIEKDLSSDNFPQAFAKKDSLKKLIKNKKKQWEFGITLSGGTSMVTKNSFKNFGGYVVPVAYNGGIPIYYFSPSEIKNSVGFIAGALIEKNISANKGLSIGISYRYFSLLNEVGGKADSSYAFYRTYTALNNAYSSAVNLKIYRNNFQYVEVPVSIKFRINSNSNFPVFWDAGINISELISTNAFQFDSNAGLYYPDNTFFNKLGFGLNAGFSATFFAKGKKPFNIGPYFYYSTTSLANKGLYDNRHFVFIELKSEILFNKR